jgi:caffeoyl-CoA O-methyltransferase
MSAEPKFISLTQEVYDYIIQHRSEAKDPLLDQLRAETEALGDVSRMLISREQGSFLTLLVAALGVSRAIEIGTFTGYSSTCIARALPHQGSLICCDESEEWTSIAQKYWSKAGVDKKIKLCLGKAAETLQTLTFEIFDFAFIDADKTGYDTYFEALLPRMKQNGVFLFDNMLWKGNLQKDFIHPDGRAIDKLNKKLSTDSRVASVLLPIADGILMCRKK